MTISVRISVKRRLLFSCLVLLICGCTVKAATKTNAKNSISSTTAATYDKPKFRDFDWKLTKEFFKNASGNCIISPIAAKLMLLLVNRTTQYDPPAAKEIEDAFGLQFGYSSPNISKETFDSLARLLNETNNSENYLLMGARLFYSEAISFPELEKRRCSKILQKVPNFNETTVNEINDWCNNETKHRITTPFIDNGNATVNSTAMLLNVIFFMGTWLKPFTRNDTHKETFNSVNSGEISVQMMSTVGRFEYLESDFGGFVLRLPYAEDNLAMYIFHPYIPDDLPSIIDGLGPEILNEFKKNKKKRLMTVRLPKFEFEEKNNIIELFKLLNINEIFKQNKLNKISDILQKIRIEVNENGSNKSVVADANEKTTEDQYPFDISVTSTFLFFIVDDKKDFLLLSGKIDKPYTIDEVYIAELEKKERERLEYKEKYNLFDKNLLQIVVKKNTETNVVISPASVKSALALVLEGAAGQSANQIAAALKVDDDTAVGPKESLYNQLKSLQIPQQPDITLKCQSRIFLSNKEDLNQKYMADIINKYNTRVHKVNFTNAIATSNSINNWVKNATDNKITTLTKPEDFKDASNTKLFLANSVYFKGEWETKFNKKQSQPECFKSEHNECLKTVFMRQRLNLKYAIQKEIDAQIVEIPFKNSRYSMVLVIPRKPYGLYEVLGKLQQEPLLHSLEDMKKVPLILSMPRMKIEFSSSLREILKLLHIEDIFNENANLTLFKTNRKGLFVNDVKHVATITVDEDGAEAAATTGIQTSERSGPIQVRANRPFIYFIRDTTQTGFLFEGVLINPEMWLDNEIESRFPAPAPEPVSLRSGCPGSKQQNWMIPTWLCEMIGLFFM